MVLTAVTCPEVMGYQNGVLKSANMSEKTHELPNHIWIQTNDVALPTRNGRDLQSSKSLEPMMDGPTETAGAAA